MPSITNFRIVAQFLVELLRVMFYETESLRMLITAITRSARNEKLLEVFLLIDDYDPLSVMLPPHMKTHSMR